MGVMSSKTSICKVWGTPTPICGETPNSPDLHLAFRRLMQTIA